MSDLILGRRWSIRLSPVGQYVLDLALRALALLVVVMALGFALASGARADDDIVANSISTVQVVSLLIGTIIPIVVALVTRTSWSGTAKSLTNLALSAVVAFGTEFINNTDNFNWQQALLTTVMTFVVSVATYFGLWSNRGTGVTAKIHQHTG